MSSDRMWQISIANISFASFGSTGIRITSGLYLILLSHKKEDIFATIIHLAEFICGLKANKMTFVIWFAFNLDKCHRGLCPGSLVLGCAG